MKNAVLPMLAIASLLLSGCSSDNGDAEQAQSSVEDSVDVEEAFDTEPADPAPGAGADGTCDVLKTLHHDVTTLPERVENEGVTEEEAEEMIAPAMSIKDDLPTMLGSQLILFEHDFQAAVFAKEADDIEEYFTRGGHESAVTELEKTTREACDLPPEWPESE